MSKDEERLRILGMIDSGLITADEAIVLLKALSERSEALPETASAPAVPPPEGEAAETQPPAASQEGSGGMEAETPAAGQEVSPAEAVSKVEEVPNAFKASTAAAPAPEVPGGAASQNEASTAETPSEAGPSAPEEPLTPEEPPAPEEPPQEFPGPDPAMLRYRRWWWIPMWVGVFITVIGATFMYLSYHSGGLGFWFACSWFPFLLGVLVLALAWASRNARWLHVRIHQKEGQRPQNINISFPIPIRLTAWFFRTFRGRIPGLDRTGVDDAILALEKVSPDTPFFVQVDEGDDGEKVEVYIG